MLRTTIALLPTLVATCFWHGNAASQSISISEGNAKALRGYMEPYRVTKLEWELLQFNLVWSGSFVPGGSTYFTSLPVFFDYRNNRFRTTFSISESREFQDPEKWSSLSRLKRESHICKELSTNSEL